MSADDACGDGTYDLTVQVSAGTDDATAGISVMLSNRNEAPTANAGADPAGVEESATVTLNGSGDAIGYPESFLSLKAFQDGKRSGRLEDASERHGKQPAVGHCRVGCRKEKASSLSDFWGRSWMSGMRETGA